MQALADCSKKINTNSRRVREGQTYDLKLVTPATVIRTVIPKRPPNSKLRTREYLTEAEVERLRRAAKGNRWGHRDATMILVAYRHRMRASELVDLRWEELEEHKRGSVCSLLGSHRPF
jgi:integrase